MNETGWMKVYGPNGWNWAVIDQTERFKRLKKDGHAKVAVHPKVDGLEPNWTIQDQFQDHPLSQSVHFPSFEPSSFSRLDRPV